MRLLKRKAQKKAKLEVRIRSWESEHDADGGSWRWNTRWGTRAPAVVGEPSIRAQQGLQERSLDGHEKPGEVPAASIVGMS